MTTNLDVLDTAVKVGLGALLGGYFSFATQAFIQDRTRDREKQKELRDRLYQITIKLGKSFEDVTHYIATALVFNNLPADPVAQSDFQEADKEYVISWKCLLSVPFELEILGLKKTSKCAEAYCLRLSEAPEIIEKMILDKDKEQKELHIAFEALMKSIQSDYQALF